jgi:hypothetical protein
MVNIVPLDNTVHADLKVDRRYSAEFGNDINQVHVFPTEFTELQREYPIFFRKDSQGTFYAVALLGLDKRENLFLNGTEWNARYVPAVLQAGPFKIGNVGQDHDAVSTIQIDTDDPRVNNSNGEMLFLKHGGHSPYLKHVINILRQIHVGHNAMGKMFEELTKRDLIEEVTLQLNISDTESYSIPGLFSINAKNFSSIDDKSLHEMHNSGLLALCHWVMASQGNIDHLVQLKIARQF